MSQLFTNDQVSGSQKLLLIYTANEPLIRLYLSVPRRWIEEYRQAPFAYKAVPVGALELYTSLHKVSRLAASQIAEPDGLWKLSESGSQWDGLSGLLLYVTSFFFSIHHDMFPVL